MEDLVGDDTEAERQSQGADILVTHHETTLSSRSTYPDIGPHAVVGTRHQETSNGTVFHGKGISVRDALFAPRSPLFMGVLLGIITALSGIAHLLIIANSHGAGFDIISYQLQAATVFDHRNVYTSPALDTRYPYPPIWIWIVAGMQLLSNTLHIRFDEAAKIPAFVGDMTLIWAMYGYARERVGRHIAALIPAVIFAFNPVTLLISASHGQFDSLVLVFMLVAFVVRGAEGSHNPLWSSLIFGIAIALKGYPVLALPYFILTAPVGKRVLSCIVSFTPLVVCIAVYSAVFGFSPNMLQHIVGYKSPPNFGWAVYLSAMSGVALVNNQGFILASEVFIIAFAVFVPIRFFRQRPAFAIAIIFFAFYATTFTMSVQYLLWVLPFVCLAAPVASVVYSVVASIAALSYYYHELPDALPTLSLWWETARALSPFRVAALVATILISGYIAAYMLLKETSLAIAFKRRNALVR